MEYPIVFIPGLFGSMGDDIIMGTGEFSFGLAKNTYKPFIQMLKSMGYEEEKNLFICHYNWKLEVLKSVDKYLSPMIKEVKDVTKSHKVIIIGHSLGGLLGRAYLEYFNPSSVSKLIMIGTPNLGSVDAYCFWSGGKFPYPKIEDNIMYNSLKVALILYYYFFEKIHYIEEIRHMFPVVMDLLPSYGYGDYLFWKEGDKRHPISIESMSVQNNFLNILEQRNEDSSKIYIISGNNINTNEKFIVQLKDKDSIKWQDGRIEKSIKTKSGDGTVTTNSSLGYLTSNYLIIDSNHIEILHKSKEYLKTILSTEIKDTSLDLNFKEINKVVIILADNCREIEIRVLDINSISNEEIIIRDENISVLKIKESRFLIMIEGDENLDYELEIKNSEGNEKIIKAIVDKDGIMFSNK